MTNSGKLNVKWNSCECSAQYFISLRLIVKLFFIFNCVPMEMQLQTPCAILFLQFLIICRVVKIDMSRRLTQKWRVATVGVWMRTAGKWEITHLRRKNLATLIWSNYSFLLIFMLVRLSYWGKTYANSVSDTISRVCWEAKNKASGAEIDS